MEVVRAVDRLGHLRGREVSAFVPVPWAPFAHMEARLFLGPNANSEHSVGAGSQIRADVISTGGMRC